MPSPLRPFNSTKGKDVNRVKGRARSDFKPPLGRPHFPFDLGSDYPLLRSDEVASVTGLAVRTVTEYAEEMGARKVGKLWLFRLSGVLRWLHKRKRQSRVG